MDTYTGGIPHVIEKLMALAGLVVLSPMLFVVALMIRATSAGPILFGQERVGRSGKAFTLLKFRSMYVNNRGPLVTAKGDSRITSIGRFLRKSKLDEVPELWNVVKGELSLVGPRPEVPKYVDINNPLWSKTLRVRPGITDPVTLRLRNEEELLRSSTGDIDTFYRETLQPYKLLGYVRYLENRTWRTDLATLYHSVLAVIFPGRAPHPRIEEIREAVKNNEYPL